MFQRSITNRDFQSRLAWLDMQYVEPDRTDHYLMQIAMEVRRVLHKHPGKVKLKDFKIKFEKKGEKVKVDYNKLAPYSIAAWKGVVMGSWKRMMAVKDALFNKPPPEPEKPKRVVIPIPQRRRRGARR